MSTMRKILGLNPSDEEVTLFYAFGLIEKDVSLDTIKCDNEFSLLFKSIKDSINNLPELSMGAIPVEELQSKLENCCVGVISYRFSGPILDQDIPEEYLMQEWNGKSFAMNFEFLYNESGIGSVVEVYTCTNINLIPSENIGRFYIDIDNMDIRHNYTFGSF